MINCFLFDQLIKIYKYIHFKDTLFSKIECFFVQINNFLFLFLFNNK
jgi:hypothetical protein